MPASSFSHGVTCQSLARDHGVGGNLCRDGIMNLPLFADPFSQVVKSLSPFTGRGLPKAG